MKHGLKHRKETTSTSKLITIIVCLLIVVGIAGAGLYFGVFNKNNEEVVEEEIDPLESIISEADRNFIDSFDEYDGLDGNYIGIIKFESDLVNLPVVHGIDNDIYLRRDWITGEYSELGSIFMDTDCSLKSENIVIYGHYVYSTYEALDENGNKLNNEELMFTPLSKLIDEANYESNKTVYLILEDEVREYEVVSVYYCPLSGTSEEDYQPDESLKYYLTEYSDEYFKQYQSKIKDVEFYDTGVDYSNDDKLLTLQTCVENEPQKREIVLCKEIERHNLNRTAYAEYQEKLAEVSENAE